MAESTALKDYFNQKTITRLGKEIETIYPAFPLRKFVKMATKDLDALELKERVHLIATAYKAYLPEDYPEALEILIASLRPELPNARDVQGMDTSFVYWPIAHFIETYGLDHLDVSLTGMHAITQRFTAEWAIRPFIVKYPDKMLKVLKKWSKDKSMHVRRLVSEGSRTRLPWGMRLQPFIDDPKPVIPLLHTLKNDPELYVRRSVANHLNDLSKDHPDLVLDILEEWHVDANKDTLWIINHALRGLIKAGDTRTLKLLGFGKAKLSMGELKVSHRTLKLGDSLVFSFSLESKAKVPQDLMVDYLVHFVKANGSTSPKVFKLGRKTLPPKGTLEIQKKHGIRPITTRVYYPGTHKIEVQVNGEILGGVEFELKV